MHDHARLTEDAALQAFAESVKGPVLRPGGEGYDAARSVWNAMIDKRPAVIVRCRGVDDVVRSVRFAREHGYAIAVRGGGHNIAGKGVCDGGLVIDLSLMNDVEVDPDSRHARVGGGATWAEVDRATQEFGLATPGGVVSSTGVGGLTLGGGFGRLSRAAGLAADNLVSAVVVTAAGEVVTAGETENADLFWGLRGGGGNFGVVTNLEFALHPVGPKVLFGVVVYPLEQAPSVLRHYRDFARAAPRSSSIWLDCLTAPPLPFLSEDMHGKPVVMVAPFYAGDLDEGERLLRPLRAFGEPVADVVERQPYTTVQGVLDPLFEAGLRNYWGSHNFVELPDGALNVIADSSAKFPTAQSDLLISHVGGAINDVASDATAYPHRDIEFIVSPGGRWTDPAQDESCITWVHECVDALAPYATGGKYVNFVTEDSGAERTAYGTNYGRLAVLKAKYDPENIFSANQNVVPNG